MTAERYPLIRGVRVDIQALRVLAHACDPSRCVHRRACCSTYEVLVDEEEMDAAAGMIREAARYVGTAPETIDPFDDTEGGHCLNTDEDGLCVFAFRGTDGGVRCSLHAAALELGLPPAAVKPKACTLWPLFLQETDPPLLTVQNDAAAFPCNSVRRRMDRPLDPGVAGIVEAIFGAAFLRELEGYLGERYG